MQQWIILTLLAFLSYSIATAIIKHFMNRGYDPVTTNAFEMLFDGILLLVAGSFFFTLSFTASSFFLSGIVGFFYAGSGTMLFYALKKREANAAIPLFQSSSILLIFALSVAIFREEVSLENTFGAILIIAGVYAILSERFSFPRGWKNVAWIFCLAAFFEATHILLAKRLLASIEPINLAVMMYFWSAFFLFALQIARKGLNGIDIKSSKIFVAAIFGGAGTILLYSALTQVGASKVYPLAGIQSVIMLFLSFAFLKERLMLHRVVGAIAVFAGIYLISV